MGMLDGEGALKWSRGFGGEGDGGLNSVAIGGDGSIYVVGYTRVASASESIALVAKLSPGGEVVWWHRMGGDGDDVFTHVVVAGDRVYVTGHTDSPNGDFPATHGGQDAVLVCFSLDGDLVWATAFGGSGADSFDSAAMWLGDKIMAVGRSASRDGDVAGARWPGYNAVLAVFDGDGSLEESWIYGGSNDGEFSDVAIGSGNQIYIVGASASDDGNLESGGWPGVKAGLRCTIDIAVPDSLECASMANDTMDATMHAVVALNENMRAAVGGWNGKDVRSEVVVDNDLPEDGWTSYSSWPDVRYLAAAAMPDGRLVVVGSAKNKDDIAAQVAMFTIE